MAAPQPDARYRRLRELLEEDPIWEDAGARQWYGQRPAAEANNAVGAAHREAWDANELAAAGRSLRAGPRRSQRCTGHAPIYQNVDEFNQRTRAFLGKHTS
jgi:hypothetical protein